MSVPTKGHQLMLIVIVVASIVTVTYFHNMLVTVTVQNKGIHSEYLNSLLEQTPFGYDVPGSHTHTVTLCSSTSANLSSTATSGNCSSASLSSTATCGYSTSACPSQSLLSNLDQYNKGVRKLSHKKLMAMRLTKNFVQRKVPSKLDPKSLQFTELSNANSDSLSVVLHVTDRKHTAVTGCNFEARLVSHDDTVCHLTLCSIKELRNGTYAFRCEGAAQCATLTIKVQFCRYQAYVHSPRFQMWDHEVLRRDYCGSRSHELSILPQDSPSWIISPDGHCEQLILHGSPLQQLSPQDICTCIRDFDDVFIIGTSHIRYLGDFLMHTCYGKNLTGYSDHHTSLQAGNVHFLDWGLLSTLQDNIHKHLDSWLQRKSSIAIWIQTGSWDFVQINYYHSMEIGLQRFNKTLSFIKSQIMKISSGARVDLRVIASAPMPKKWYWNNFAIGAFNARMQQISLEHGIHYTDAFSMELPCANDIPKLQGNNNHYFARHKNHFAGNVGASVYFAAFLPQICLPVMVV